MSRTATATKNTITLRGSTEIVTEFFGFAVNSILYQRGIYPSNTFETVQRYGLPMLITTDSALKEYLGEVLRQLTGWLLKGQVKKLVVVVCAANTGTTLERWTFNIEADKQVQEGNTEVAYEKPQKEITKEIQAIIRQITASVTFLPLIEEACTFDLLVYTNKDTDVPQAWEESDPKYIAKSHEVKLRSFSTKIHKVEGTVCYKLDDEEEEGGASSSAA